MATQVAIPQIRKAEKRRVKLKIGITGPSGSGKTKGALWLANLWPDAKILVVDTENESASLYADEFDFDTLPLNPPYHSDRYESCIEAAVRGGYDVLIMDTITHQWDGEGGILRRKEELDQRPGANSYTNWSKFTPEHTQFIESIKQAPIHIIATMRSKQDYIMETSDKGKSKPVKVGLAPIQRDGFDYEFSVVFDVQMDHKAVASKDRTGLFSGAIVDLADKKIAEKIRDWHESGKQVQEADRQNWTAAPQPPTNGHSPAKPPQATRSNGAAPQQKVAEWKLEADQLSCFVYDAQKRPGKNGEFAVAKHNGQVNGKDAIFCFHAGLFDAVLASRGKKARFQIDTATDYVTVTDVIQIEEQAYRDGKPYTEPEPTPGPAPIAQQLEITDEDIPF
jgi:energy-coupling factor transporter ATP-binding protein EcfA2